MPTTISPPTSGPCIKCGAVGPYAKGRRECPPCKRKGLNNWRRENRAKVAVYNRASGQKAKRELMDALGGVCECCGETELAFLTLDHRHGVVPPEHRGPTGARLSGKMLLTQIRREGFPRDKYRVLCFNCNVATAHGRTCPHELARKVVR